LGEAHHLPASLDDSTRFVMKVPFPAWLIMRGQEKLKQYADRILKYKKIRK
jgi:hypothetical protein